MKTFSIPILSSIVIALLANGAAAQTNTEEARAMAAQVTAAQQREQWAHPPVAEPVAIGDYRAEAHQRQRMQQWEASQRAARAYAAGVRSKPMKVTSEDSARAEIQRVHSEQALAEQAATMQATASAK